MVANTFETCTGSQLQALDQVIQCVWLPACSRYGNQSDRGDIRIMISASPASCNKFTFTCPIFFSVRLVGGWVKGFCTAFLQMLSTYMVKIAGRCDGIKLGFFSLTVSIVSTERCKIGSVTMENGMIGTKSRLHVEKFNIAKIIET